jgi:hypothetical protein
MSSQICLVYKTILSSENMEIYLVSLNSSLDFTEKLQKVKDDCSIDFDGSKLHKYINILVGNFKIVLENSL